MGVHAHHVRPQNADRIMTQKDYNSYSHWRVNEEITMPELCGGYTQADWDILNGAMVDREYLDDYCVTPSEKYGYMIRTTKPYWA